MSDAGRDVGLAGRVALVTGGSRGVGRAIALGLASDGADVAVNYHRDSDAADEVVELVRAGGRRAIAVKAAVEDATSAAEMVQVVELELGPVGILVSNAGIASRGRTVADTTPDEVHRMLSVHAAAAHHLCSLVVPGMRRAQRGDIVLVSSTTTDLHNSLTAPYTMAKAALESLGLVLAAEEARAGIRVNVVAPGLVETEMGRRLVAARAGASLGDLHEHQPFGRVCQPEDVASVVRFLVSDAGSYVTGARVPVHGGAATSMAGRVL